MKISSFKGTSLLALLSISAPLSAIAHLGYNGRDFGSYSSSSPRTLTIFNQTVSTNFGWADGTDADFGDSHHTRIFKFTLEDTALVTISVESSTNGGTRLGSLLPGFSLFSGLAHSGSPDYDGTPISVSYLQSLGAPAKEGVFNALETWKVGNEDGVTFDDLTTFTYMGHAVDGTSANFGTAPNVVGDNNLDGFVKGTFLLQPGAYSFFVGGANYAGQAPTADAGVYGIQTTVSAVAPVPEPTSLAFLASVGVLALSARGRKRRA